MRDFKFRLLSEFLVKINPEKILEKRKYFPVNLVDGISRLFFICLSTADPEKSACQQNDYNFIHLRGLIMCGIIGSFPAADANGLAWHSPDPTPGGRSITAGKYPLGQLGHTRLAILDVAQGQKPMSDGNLTIVFNGEIYNYQSLKTKYRKNRYTQRYACCLKLYQYLGLTAFNGWTHVCFRHSRWPPAISGA